MLQYLDRLNTYVAIYGDAFDSESYAKFRDCDLVAAAIEYAHEENFKALEVRNLTPRRYIFTFTGFIHISWFSGIPIYSRYPSLYSRNLQSYRVIFFFACNCVFMIYFTVILSYCPIPMPHGKKSSGEAKTGQKARTF